MKISVIIPTYNEAAAIGPLVRFLRQQGGDHLSEIIVVDGGSTDATLEEAREGGAVAHRSPQKGRAAQMNFGASLATGEVLYFVHADTVPPHSFTSDILAALKEGYDLGRYKTRFDSGQPFFRINEWFTRFDLFICMGGDQTLFIRRSLFDALKGFREEMQIMEEYEFCKRARQQGRYKIMEGAALVSARKYNKNSWLRVQLANYTVVRMYKRGASQESLVQEYKRRLIF